MQPTEYRLMQWSRYTELQQHMEKKIPDPAAARTGDLFNLCYAYVKVKNYEKGLECAEELERNIREGDNKLFGYFDVSSTPHLIRAEAYLDFGDYPRAVEEAKKGYDVAVEKREHKQFLIYALGELSLAHALTGDRTEAEKYAKLLEKIGTFYPDNGVKPDKMNALARTYMALGNYEKALKKLRSSDYGFSIMANVITGTALVGESIFTYNELPKKFMMNKCLYETGRTAEAKRGYEKLLQHPGTSSNGDIYWMMLFDLGRIGESEGRLDQAVDYYEKAVTVFEEQRSTIRTEASKIGYVGNKQAVYHHLIAALFAQARHGEAFEYVERSKSRALVDLLASKKDFAVQKGDEQEIQSIIKKLDALEAEGKIQATDTNLNQLSQKRSAKIEFAEKLKRTAPELASLVTVTTVSTAEIQSRLSPDETLVEYYYQDDDLYAFVLTQGGLNTVKLNGANLFGEVQEFRAALEDPASKNYLELSEHLYQRLAQPLEPLLGNPNLILVPHGILHYLPFNALKSEKGYLIDRFSIRYLPSASVMNYLSQRKTPDLDKILAVGNPEFGERKAPLTFAEQEARTIAKSFPEPTLLLQKEATETVFKKIGGHFPYIHLATHGIFESESPLSSGLLLAQDPDNDGLLSVEEIYSLRLDTDLVTLSACETGLSKISNGDDLVGLTRGFLYAGSRAIVASLWSVDDQATALLMNEFYSMLSKANTRDALREAQLTAKKKYEHPFYWAAFQLTGAV